MTERYLIPLSDGRWLALESDTFQAALSDGAAAVGSTARRSEPETAGAIPLKTAEEVASLTNIDASWFLARARMNEIPHVRFGKYVRFDLAAVTAHLARDTDTRTAYPEAARKQLIRKPVSAAVSTDVSNSRRATGARCERDGGAAHGR